MIRLFGAACGADIASLRAQIPAEWLLSWDACHKVGKKVMDNLMIKKCFQIITSVPEPIEAFITGKLHRGATQLHGEGVYTHEGKTVLLTVVSRHEAVLLRNFIRENDPSAFLIITSSTEIIGNGFRGVN